MIHCGIHVFRPAIYTRLCLLYISEWLVPMESELASPYPSKTEEKGLSWGTFLGKLEASVNTFSFAGKPIYTE